MKLYNGDNHCTTASLIIVPPWKMSAYIQNTLFVYPTEITNEWKMKCKNINNFDQVTFLSPADQQPLSRGFFNKLYLESTATNRLPFRKNGLVEERS